MALKIAVIGAGFAGLGTAYYLSKTGHQVTVFEKDSQPGGLAVGFKNSKWSWPLEKHYHHLFTTEIYTFPYTTLFRSKKIVSPGA